MLREGRLFTEGYGKMKLKAVSGIMLTLLLIGMLTLAFDIQPASASIPVHNIDTGLDYATIQEAINAPETLDGHTILVDAGTYYERVTINKSILLSGENRENTIIDGSHETGFHVISDNVNISGFTIRNCGPLGYGRFSGIHLDSCDNCKIYGNMLNDNGVGIWPDSSSNNTIFNNTLSNCAYAIGWPEMKGNNQNIFDNFMSNNSFGIYLIYSADSIVSNNTIVNSQRLSIYLQFCSDIILTNNNMTGNIYGLEVFGISLSDFIHDIDTSNTVDGKPVYYLINQRNLIIDPLTFPDAGFLGLVNSTNVIIKNLKLSRSGQGLLLAYTTCSTVTHLNVSFNFEGIDMFTSGENIITDNEITSNRYNGIQLNHCDSNTIINNTISNNGEDAILMGLSDSNIIRCNTLSKNYRGISLYSCDGNIIYHNNFVDNTEKGLSTQSTNTWDNGYPSGGNYWSDYTGFDIKSGPNQDQPGSDGMGDTPYVIDANNRDRYPLMYAGPYYQLTVTSSPITGITFTINGNPKTTPYTEWLLEGSYTLEMPETHDGYVWSHWLEDGNPNRIKTVTINTNITLTGVYAAKPVGGKATPINIPMNKPETPTLWILLSTIIPSLIAATVFIKHKKKKQ